MGRSDTFGVTLDHQAPAIAPGGSAQLDLPALAAGSYDALCTVSGHVDLGMVATVVARSDGGSASWADPGSGADPVLDDVGRADGGAA